MHTVRVLSFRTDIIKSICLKEMTLLLFCFQHTSLLTVHTDLHGHTARTARRVIHKEFVLEGKTINAVYYKGVMERLLNRIRRVRPGMCESGDWFLLHDNAPSHNATIIKQFLAQQKVTVLDHPSYSPDLVPADYFLFQKVKSHLKGRLFTPFGTSSKP